MSTCRERNGTTLNLHVQRTITKSRDDQEKIKEARIERSNHAQNSQLIASNSVRQKLQLALAFGPNATSINEAGLGHTLRLNCRHFQKALRANRIKPFGRLHGRVGLEVNTMRTVQQR